MAALRLLLAACLLTGLTSLPGARALAHGGLAPRITIPQSVIERGGTLVVSGDDFEPAEEVSLEVAGGQGVQPLGTLTTDQVGHFLAEFRLSDDVTEGDAYVQVASSSGWVASLWFEVGDPAARPPGPPSSQLISLETATPPWFDPSLIVLGLFVAGTGLAFASAVWRSRMGPPQRRARRT
ncbi:MAG TPA: hypothetical protein VMP67_00575 [Candidatus Limnocylindria bacterium]|nr:hypothetical protein [Candidatus Limnocylindria bacterium]